ncbi:MAG: hypothetical protein ACK4NY_05460 [Spirosomataceae bacterium]
MKNITIIFLVFINQMVFAQSFEGIWVGTVSGQNGSVQSELTIKNLTNNQISGELVVFSGAEKDSYSLKSNTTGSNALGKLTYKDGTTFDCSMSLVNGQIQQKILYQGQVILQGVFTKKGANQPQNVVTKDNLFRDTKLVGRWTYSENYSSSGGFYGGTQSTIVLNADGTVDDGGATSYASGGGNSVMNKGGENQMITQLKALNARWFTKGNIFCWRITIDGKTTDVENSKYYIENGALLMTDLKTGKKTLYQKK